jgi:glutamate-1-semialdehyde 2,1-aminomutase
MAAGFETLTIIREDREFYKNLEVRSARLAAGIQKVIDDGSYPLIQNRVGSMFTTFFTRGPVTDYATAAVADRKKFASFFRSMLEKGIALAPSQFEAGFMSIAHTNEDIDRTVEAAGKALKEVFG